MTTVVIMQARMGSTRLPGKIFKDLAGKTALDHCVERTMRCDRIDDLVIATTVESRDDVIVDKCKAEGWRYFRGSENDVLERYYLAAKDIGAEHVVRVTSDCPLNDPEVIGSVIDHYRADGKADFACNCLPKPTFPMGIVTEVIRFSALERAYHEDKDPAWREHVTPYIYGNPDLFRLLYLPCESDFSQHRWTLDTPDDLALIRRIFEHFGHNRFTWREALEVAQANPEWQQINAHIEQKVVPAPD